MGPRMPSASMENVFRQLMALMSIMEAQYKGSESYDHLSVVEVIHPMSAELMSLLKQERECLTWQVWLKKNLTLKYPLKERKT